MKEEKNKERNNVKYSNMGTWKDGRKRGNSIALLTPTKQTRIK